MATLLLTVLGDDRPGLVSSLSAPLAAHRASWERSQMARLAGKFTGIAVISVAAERCDALVADLTALASSGLAVAVERTDIPAARDTVGLVLDLLGADRPGIVAEISAALAGHGVNIEELATDVREAPMAGGRLFEAHAVLSAPGTADVEVLRAALEALGDELMVDVSLSED